MCQNVLLKKKRWNIRTPSSLWYMYVFVLNSPDLKPHYSRHLFCPAAGRCHHGRFLSGQCRARHWSPPRTTDRSVDSIRQKPLLKNDCHFNISMRIPCIYSMLLFTTLSTCWATAATTCYIIVLKQSINQLNDWQQVNWEPIWWLNNHLGHL